VEVLFFISLYRNTDNNYILSPVSRTLFYHFRFFWIKKLTPWLRFTDICSITVDGVRNHNKSSVWFEYRIVLIDSGGRITALSDFKRDSFFEQLEQARNLAQITGAHLTEPKEEMMAKPVAGPRGKWFFTHVPHTFFDSIKEFMIYTTISTALVLTFLAVTNYKAVIAAVIKILGK
jgi:hypothetical protein